MPFHFRKKLLALFLSVFAGCFVAAQDYKFSHLGVENGLSQSVINCILQDSRGFMWFGTQEGLNRYDGYNFTIFKRNTEDSASLSNNFIYSMRETRDGLLWVGTNGGGLNCFNPATGKFTHYKNDPKNANSLSNDIVRVILEDREGNLWVGTDDGLNLLDRATGKFTRFTSNENDPFSLSSGRVYDLIQDGEGNIWVGTYGKGICMFDRASRKFFNYQLTESEIAHFYPSDFSNDAKRRAQCQQVRSLLIPDPIHLWVGTNGGGIEVFNIASHSFESVLFPNGNVNALSNTKVLSMCDDQRGNTWLGVFESGIDIYNRSTGQVNYCLPVEHDNYSLSSSEIKTLYRDRNGNMWVGTNGEGINVHFFSTAFISHIRKSEATDAGENTLKSNKILSIMLDKSGLLWIGTSGGGLTTLDRKKGNYTQHPELSTATNNSVLSLLQASDSTIWVGTYGEGLNHYFPKTKKVVMYPPNDRLGDGNILCITEEPGTGKIWFGTFGAGIYCLDPKTDSLQEFTSDSDSLSSDYIYTLFFDRTGSLWIGTRSGGAMKRDKTTGKFIQYVHNDTDKQSLSNNIVYCITQDMKGNIWMSTANGLNQFHPESGKFTTYYERDGLWSDNVYAILPDEKGNLWLSHNKGITRFSPDAKGDARFRNFGPGAGVQSSEFNQGAFFRSNSGELFFGGQKGINIVDTRKQEWHSLPPQVYLIAYKRFGKEVHLDSNIIAKQYINVTWRDNYFFFELAALDYVDPSKNQYQYRLEGADEEWSPATTNRYISYTNLPGGHYRLHVRVADSNGNWSEDRVVVSINVEPPFWRTNWFYSLCVVVLIAGIIVFIRYRTAAIKKENRILEAKVAERTHELAQKNADITASIEYARRIQSAILPELNEVYHTLPESFVLYKPKDIVSGDFYWFAEKNGLCIFAVADCTGHGVPGALMSMIGHNLLNQIILEKGVTDPDEVLNRLNDGVRAALKQDHHEQDTSDGMDIAICTIDTKRREVLFAGALRPLILVKRGLLSKIESDRFPIGGSQDTRERKFTLHRFLLEAGDTIYMFSDGFADQFGGEKGKKYMMKRLLETLLKYSHLSMPEQSTKLDQSFESWKGEYMQVDDVLLVGIRLS